MANNVSRFSLFFDITGNWEDALAKMGDRFERLTTVSSESATKITAANSQIVTVLESMESLNASSKNVMNTGMGYFQAFGDFVKDGMSSVMPLESMMQRIQATTHASKEATRDIVQNAMDLAEKTPFLAQHVAQLSTGLALAKVPLDAFKDSVSGADLTLDIAQKRGFAHLDNAVLGMAGTMKVTAASMLADLATLSGQGPERMGNFVYGMERALQTGQTRMLADNLPIAYRQAIFGTSGGQMKITAKQAMDNLFKFLQKEGAIGAAAAGSTTVGAILENFKDLPGKMYRTILGMPGDKGFFDQFRKELGDLYTLIATTFNDPAFLNSVKEAITPIITSLLAMAHAFSWVVSKMLIFVKDNPKLVAGLLKMATAAAGLLVLAGAIGTVISGLAIMGVTVFAIASTWPVVVGALQVGVLIFGYMAAAIAGLIAVGWAFAQAYETNFGGFRDMCLSVYYVMSAVSDGIINMTSQTTKFSGETAAALEKLGLLDFVLNILSYANSIYNFFKSLGEGFKSAYQYLAPGSSELMAAFEHLAVAIFKIVIVGAKIIASMFGMRAEFEKNNGVGKGLGVTLGGLVAIFIRLVEAAALVLSVGADVARVFVEMMTVCQVLFAPFAMVKDLLVGLYTCFDDLMSGNFIQFFKDLGYTIANVVLKPVQMLVAGLIHLLDLLGKSSSVNATLRAFSEGGLKNVLEPDTEATASATRSSPWLRPVAAQDAPVPDIQRAPVSMRLPEMFIGRPEAFDRPQATAAQQPNITLPPIEVNVLMDNRKIATGLNAHYRQSMAARGT